MKVNKTLPLKGSCNAKFDSINDEVTFSEYGEYLFKLSYHEIDMLKNQADVERKTRMEKIMDFF